MFCVHASLRLSSNYQEVLLNQKNELFIKEKGKEWTLLKDLVVSKASVFEDSIIVSTPSPGEIIIMKKGATEGHVVSNLKLLFDRTRHVFFFFLLAAL